MYALWRAQEEREADRRERIRAAVAASTVPLPPELVAAVINLNDTHTRAILRDHPGYTLAERRNSYLTSLQVMEQCLQDLLTVICVFENEALAEDSILYRPGRRQEVDNTERRVQKELFATANAAASLVDHSRRIHKCWEIPGYDAQRLTVFGSDGLHEFVIGLRVVLHHLHLVEAGWSIRHSLVDDEKHATFMIYKSVIARVLTVYPDRFGGTVNTAMNSYLAAAPDEIDLRAVFLDYRARVTIFHDWMKKQLESEDLVALRDYDKLLRDKVNSDHRMQWKALLGNWLNWKQAPDPHNHLNKFLTVDQLEAVYKLPRNSKEQVDLVLGYMDDDQVVDDSLRSQAYELFRRSSEAAAHLSERSGLRIPRSDDQNS